MRGPTAEEDFILATEELVDPGPRVDPHAADLEAEILGILERTLALENVACQEAALHGLGHRHHKHASQVEVIVDTYLRRHLPTWPPDEQGESLRGYALAARGRQGAVIVAAARTTASGRRVQQGSGPVQLRLRLLDSSGTDQAMPDGRPEGSTTRASAVLGAWPRCHDRTPPDDEQQPEPWCPRPAAELSGRQRTVRADEAGDMLRALGASPVPRPFERSRRRLTHG